VVDTPLIEKPYYLMLSNALVKARPELAEQIWKQVEEVRNSKEYGKMVKAAGAENAR
jgi:polar amino acid transport system substrate-binding protein